MKRKYIDYNFRRDSLSLINTANEIITDYMQRGYSLTLRQLYYQLVARDMIPNHEKMYNKLGNTIARARDAGLVDWSAIVDRTRNKTGLSTWEDPGEILDAVGSQFRLDKWKNQDHTVSVWVEKEALAGIISQACTAEQIQVSYVSCRGYMSASTIWREAQAILRASVMEHKQPIILHLGDHDPSGMDMTRDNEERLALYSGLWPGEDFILKRIALNYDQVEEYDPPPNPAKLTDSRADGYVAEYGYSSWELDALDPDVLVDLIRDEVRTYVTDWGDWNTLVALEAQYKERLAEMANNWEEYMEV